MRGCGSLLSRCVFCWADRGWGRPAFYALSSGGFSITVHPVEPFLCEQVTLTDEEIVAIAEWAGTHPYLIQQLLNELFDNQRQQPLRPLKNLCSELLLQRSRDFSRWWHADQGDGPVEIEQRIYAELIAQREGTAESLAAIAGLPPGKVADALQLLAGTGVIRQLDDERYEIGARLFKEWVLQQ